MTEEMTPTAPAKRGRPPKQQATEPVKRKRRAPVMLTASEIVAQLARFDETVIEKMIVAAKFRREADEAAKALEVPAQ